MFFVVNLVEIFKLFEISVCSVTFVGGEEGLIRLFRHLDTVLKMMEET
jgi:hypothetical protein